MVHALYCPLGHSGHLLCWQYCKLDQSSEMQELKLTVYSQFLTVMPFVRPPGGKGNTSLPYWLSSVVALAILSLGIVYYLLRFVLAPFVFGYRHETLQKELSDGSAVTRFRRIKNT